jgi:hypothetical protein
MMKHLVVLGLLLAVQAASAQQPQPACTYEACALRIIDGGGYFALPFVVQGREGYGVGPVRRSDALDHLFAVSDSSASYYAKFETQDLYADWFGWVGTGLLLTGFVVDIFGDGGLFSKSFLLYGGGLAVTWGVALPAERRAGTHLANAIWWYNQSLARGP